MSIGERIRTRREELGLSQAELAKRIGVTQGSIGNYESGVSNPKMELMQKLFDALETDANYIFHEVLDAQRIEFTYDETIMIQKYRTLDEYGKKAVDVILETELDRCLADEEQVEGTIEIRHSYYKVSAGRGVELDEGDNWETIFIPDTPDSRKSDFALTIQGNSMEPVYLNGDIVLVKEQPAVELGQIGIYVINGTGYIKKYGGDRLISINTEYDDIVFSEYDNIRCVGKVIGRV